MMGIMVPETCWTSNKICNKKHLLHLVGILFPQTSRSLTHERVNKWPSSILTRWRRRWWCDVVMEGVWQPVRNCANLTFQYKGAKYLLHFPIYPTSAIIRQSQAYATSIPESKAMEYFKSIDHICNLCICIEVKYLQTCSYIGNILPNLWNSKQCVRKLNSIYYETDGKQNARLHHTQPRQTKYSITNSSKSLVSRIQNISQVSI
jgi:hypothetical protein